MALKIAMVATNPFALNRAIEQFVAQNIEDVIAVGGMGRACQIQLVDGTVVKLLSEADWRRGAYCREPFDQIFWVAHEALGIDFMLELQECLKGSCVPEEWQWQRWEGGEADAEH